MFDRQLLVCLAYTVCAHVYIIKLQ